MNKGYTGLTSLQETLPASFYLDPDHHQRELNAIWYRHWVYVGRAESLHGAGAFRTIMIGSQNILIVRDENLELQAFIILAVTAAQYCAPKKKAGCEPNPSSVPITPGDIH